MSSQRVRNTKRKDGCPELKGAPVSLMTMRTRSKVRLARNDRYSCLKTEVAKEAKVQGAIHMRKNKANHKCNIKNSKWIFKSKMIREIAEISRKTNHNHMISKKMISKAQKRRVLLLVVMGAMIATSKTKRQIKIPNPNKMRNNKTKFKKDSMTSTS